MKYIIDIPETYKYAVEIGMTKNGSIASKDILNAVKDGIPYIERPHGEWKYAIVDCYKSGYICPHCNGFAVIDGKSDGYSVTFCPNCGSDNRPRILDVAFDGAGKDGNVKEGEEK